MGSGAIRRLGDALLCRAVVAPFLPSGFRSFAPSARSAAPWRGTTVLAVRKGNDVCVVGDGQVTMGSSVVKNNARKVRRLGPNDRVVAGFAGATADALSLFERLEAKLEEHPEQLLRACVSLAKDWRTDKYLRRLDAVLLVCDRDNSLYLTGTGDVLEPPDGLIGIGSGGNFAVAAARALADIDTLSAKDVAIKSMNIASDLCIYTNSNYVIESVPPEEPQQDSGSNDLDPTSSPKVPEATAESSSDIAESESSSSSSSSDEPSSGR